MKHIKLFGFLAVVCLALATVSCSKENNASGSSDPTPGKQDGTVTSLKGTTWATGEQMGIGTLTLSFTDKDATLKRVADGKTTGPVAMVMSQALITVKSQPSNQEMLP